MEMSIGKFKGQPIEAMPTAYIAWCLSQDHFRFKNWPLVEEMLKVLRSRLADADSLHAELRVETMPKKRRRPEPRWAARKRERMEKRLHKMTALLRRQVNPDDVSDLI
ncbi:hypothetical protein [Magnetospirillum aberrantis]|uniref:Uncharacterized protein n=1 Tax=Magnetospirillum aberrantis SpK TaxID=908842 RepID=A0A7C9UZJ0_9PROT|nr:hypothetical protein [Magnetospirillum aberrantis]NFV82112.1 hypothetical protein [Magnetospirillum aberrantis SpK]